MDFMNWEVTQEQQMNNQKDILSHMLHTVTKLYFKYKERKDLIKEEDENSSILANFYIKLREYIKGLDKEEKDKRMKMSQNATASWEEGMNEIEQFKSYLSAARLICNINAEEFSDIEKIYEEDFKELEQKIDALRKRGKMMIEKLVLKSNESEQKKFETKTSEDEAHLRSSAIRSKLTKFRNSLINLEIGENFYWNFLEITKASWEKQMNELREHETTIYLLSHDIIEDFENIEKMYEFELKELNRKIITFKETDKAEKNEETQTILKLLQQIQTDMQKLTQIEKPEKKSEDIANIQLSRFRRKISKLKNQFDIDMSRTHDLYSTESIKTHWINQMDEIKQLEYELATVYLLGNDIDKEFEEIEAQFYRIFLRLNDRIGTFRDKTISSVNF